MGYSEGLDAEISREVGEEKKTVDFQEEKSKRRPFHIWAVGENMYRLKLKASMIGALERKYGKNVLNLVSDEEGLPPLSVMLTIIQAAASPWNHGMDYNKVKTVYDEWCDYGGNQMELLSEIIMPTLVVSGFFTKKQGDMMMEELKSMDETI